MNFNLKTTSIYQAVRLDRNLLFKLRRFFKILFFVLFCLSVLIFLFGTLTGGLSREMLKHSIGGVMVMLSCGLFFLEISSFFNSKVVEPELKYSLSEVLSKPEEFNLASFLDFESAKICFQAQKAAKKRKFKETPKELLFYFLLQPQLKEINFIFGRAALSLQKIKEEVNRKINGLTEGWALEFEKIILEALEIASGKNKKRITLGDILVSFSQRDEFFKKVLVLNDLKAEDIENLVDWYQRIEKRISENKKFWEYENLLKKGFIAKDWATGYSITLDKYSIDLRKILEKAGFREIVGHKKEIENTERILSKEEYNNVLLVGEPGTGRGSIVRAVAQKAFSGKSSPAVNYKRVLKFELGQLATHAESSEELETLLEECFSQSVKAGNIILNIEEIHNFLSSAFKPGTFDVSGILSRYLPLSSFQIIATTSYQGLHTIMERRPALLSFFEKVEVLEISEKETLEMLENFLPFFERKYKRFIEYKALREILRLSSRYLQDTPFPEKAVRLLDESVSWLIKFSKEKVLTPGHLKRIVSEKIEIPIETIEKKEREVLLKLEELIHQRIINQEEAVKEISSALRRARAEVKIKSGPIGSFLFLGPTGVGKTETSKALSAIYFGSEKRMIRIDMSEFQTVKDIKRLIGGGGEKGFLTTAVKENPFSLVLLDEIEKAHPNILNLFLQVLDEGWLTDGFGRKIDFKNTVIIATSNAGSEFIRQDIQQNKQLDIVKEDLLDYLLRNKMFKPEFINRFDAVVVFKPLTKENLLLICRLMLRRLADNLKNKGISFEINQQLKEKIVELSYSPQFGAREMQRVIQNKVENLLAKAILDGKLKRGNKVEIKVEGKNFNLNILENE